MPTLHWWTRASSVSPYVITIAWGIAPDIIIHHWSIACELFTYCSSLIYFSVATVTITIKPKLLLLLPLPLLSYYFATKHFVANTKFPGVVELTTQLLILENILWLLLCRINKFGLNTLPSKTVAIPYTCGLSIVHLWCTLCSKIIICDVRIFLFTGILYIYLYVTVLRICMCV